MVGPTVWNRPPLALRLLPRVHSDVHVGLFYSSLKTAFLAVLELEALLSSNLEEALYKSM